MDVLLSQCPVMLDCSEFLDQYSDFRDGLLEEERTAAFHGHLASCSSCARYDRVIGGGVRVLRDLPELTPSFDFEARLQHRIFHLEDTLAGRHHASGASLVATLGICTAIGLGAWLPTMRGAEEPVRLPPVVAHAPHHFEVAPVLFHSGPLLARRAHRPDPVSYQQTTLLQSYSLSSPVAARPVSTFYYPVP